MSEFLEWQDRTENWYASDFIQVCHQEVYEILIGKIARTMYVPEPFRAMEAAAAEPVNIIYAHLTIPYKPWRVRHEPRHYDVTTFQVLPLDRLRAFWEHQEHAQDELRMACEAISRPADTITLGRTLEERSWVDALRIDPFRYLHHQRNWDAEKELVSPTVCFQHRFRSGRVQWRTLINGLGHVHPGYLLSLLRDFQVSEVNPGSIQFRFGKNVSQT